MAARDCEGFPFSTVLSVSTTGMDRFRLSLFELGFSEGKGYETLAFQCEQDLSASHVFETTIWLYPIPFLAEDFRNLGTPFVPMLRNSCLNKS